jgi:acyl-CoA thioesterase FadM
MLSDPARLVLRRRVEWMDTDAAGIYHWTTAFRFAEAAEAALHTALGIAEITFGATPRVHVEADFRRPLLFNEPVDIELSVRALGRSTVDYVLAISGSAGPAVTGGITAVFIDRDTGRAARWPDHVRERLAAGGSQEERA